MNIELYLNACPVAIDQNTKRKLALQASFLLRG
jgi:hypothetical protein